MLSNGNSTVKIDCSVLDPIKGVIARSWKVEIELEGGTVASKEHANCDLLERVVKDTIHSRVNNSLIIPIKSKNIELIQTKAAQSWRIKPDGNMKYQTDSIDVGSSVFPIMANRVTSKNLESEIEKLIRLRLSKHQNNVKIALRSYDR